MSIRILIADDHEIFAEGLRALLEAQPEMEVIGHVSNGLAAVERTTEESPDLVVMDLSMPGMNGMQATREITTRDPGQKVLALSMHAERRFVEAALEAGASGYVLKDGGLEELLRAVRSVATGQVYLDPRIAGVVVESYRGRRPQAMPDAFSLLTDRERGVLQLLAEGISSHEIAKQLHVSVKTVGSHRAHIQSKLGIRSLAGLTKYAIREGLTSASD